MTVHKQMRNRIGSLLMQIHAIFLWRHEWSEKVEKTVHAIEEPND